LYLLAGHTIMGNMIGSTAEEEPEPPCCSSGSGNAPGQRAGGGGGGAAAGDEPPPSVPEGVAPALLIPGWSAAREGETCSEMLSTSEIAALNAKVGAPVSWELLFSSKRHGKSYNRMIKEVCHKGASLVVIREEGPEGRVFGGYADCSWVEGALFFGSSKCFLFQILPAAADSDGAAGVAATANVVYHRAVGRDKNHLYVNSGSEGNPNCLAFGGELYNFAGDGKTYTGVFGLSIETSMTRGTCAEVTTFGNPIFPAEIKPLDRSFAIDEVEIWATDPDFELSVDEKYELQKKMGRGVDAGLDFVLESAGVAQNAKAAGIDDHKPAKGS